MEAFSKVLNDVHNKMYTGDILHREPSHVLLPEEEYPVPVVEFEDCLLYTSPSPRDGLLSRMPSSA